MFANIQQRIQTIDIVRGIVMIIMALDHSRDLFHLDFLKNDPLDYNTTHPFLFFTRWITHLCAPVFVFLSGVSVYLNVLKENSIAKSRSFLIKRGLWLIFLEFTVIGFAIFFDIEFKFLFFQVIGAIGFGFIVLGLLLFLDAKVITAIGLLILLTHNLLDFAPDNIKAGASVFFLPVFIPISEVRVLGVGYPLIPWMAIMFVGFGSGILFLKNQDVRKKIFSQLGLLLLIAFVVIRFLNVYGNQSPWEEKQSTIFTILSFLDLTKYPPSLLFSMFFLGIMFFLLYLFDKKHYNKFDAILKVYGSVPLFYYVLHWIVLHFIQFIMLKFQGFSFSEMLDVEMGRPREPNGLNLTGVYIVWIIVIILLYPICKAFSNYKAKNKHKSWLRFI